MTQVSFLYDGAYGYTARRTLTGTVLEQRARRDGATDFLVKSPALPLSKWINAEFCAVLPEVVEAVSTTVDIQPVAEQLVTPRQWLISQGYELARAAGVNAAVELETIANEWAREDTYQAALDYYLSAMQSDVARQRLYRAVESKAVSTATRAALTA